MKWNVQEVTATAAVSACVATFALIAVNMYVAQHDPGTEAHSTAVPACTDEIADAGGICKGEPVSAPESTTFPTPTPTPSVTTVNPPKATSIPTPKQSAAPAKATASKPTHPAYVPIPACATEDSEDCYWDAATMGDGEGNSFVRWHGTTYHLTDNLTAADFPQDMASIPTCHVADDSNCYYPGRDLGDRCDWVNWWGLSATWFFNCDDPTLEGVVR